MRLTPRVSAGLGLAAALFLAADPAPAQEVAKGPAPVPAEAFRQLQERLAEGRYDLAALFLRQFVESNPSDQLLVDIEADRRYGATVFRRLRNVPRWSDDPAVEKQARADVETVVKRATEATDKLLRNPARVNKYIRNLGESPEEQRFAEDELRRTGDYAVPFMVEALRAGISPAVTTGILRAIPKLDVASVAAWLAAFDGLTVDQRYGVFTAIVSRPDVLNLTQTNFIPGLWRAAGNPENSPGVREFAQKTLEGLIPGAARKDPAVELVALARPFLDRKARYLGAVDGPPGTPPAVPVWQWNEAEKRLVKTENVPASQADEYYGLRYARWALQLRPGYEPAQALILTMASERAMERGGFADLARGDPAVYKLLADAPAVVLSDLLDRAIAEKRTGVVLAVTQVLGDRAEKGPASASTGKPSLYERALNYPDPRVQLAAAFALLRAPVPVAPGLRGRVVDVLKRAAGADTIGAAGSKGQALLVDPDRRRADDTAAYLRGMGLAVDIYPTGRDVLRRVGRSADVDLIVADRHVPAPDLPDLVAQLRADTNVARVPVLVVASADRPIPPSFDQILLRLALLVAATDTDPIRMPPPYVPDLRKTPEARETDRSAVQAQRDNVFASAAANRLDRLRRMLETTGLELTEDQRYQLRQRMEQITYAALAAEFPLSAESAPRTAREVDDIVKRIVGRPNVPEFTREAGLTHLMRLIERFEVDVAKAPAAQARYDALRARVDATELGLVVRPPRDFEVEARVARSVGRFPGVFMIPEPYSRVWFEAAVNSVFADPADRPRDAAQKALAARLALAWLSRMATGEVAGFDVRPAAAEMAAALRADDLADAAIDGVAHTPTADAQNALVTLAVNSARPVALRTRAALAAARHVQVNGALTGKSLIEPLTARAGDEADPFLRGRLLVLKSLLAPTPADYAAGLQNYDPPLVPPPAAKDAPPPKPKDPAEGEKEADPKGGDNPKQ